MLSPMKSNHFCMLYAMFHLNLFKRERIEILPWWLLQKKCLVSLRSARYIFFQEDFGVISVVAKFVRHSYNFTALAYANKIKLYDKMWPCSIKILFLPAVGRHLMRMQKPNPTHPLLCDWSAAFEKDWLDRVLAPIKIKFSCAQFNYCTP